MAQGDRCFVTHMFKDLIQVKKFAQNVHYYKTTHVMLTVILIYINLVAFRQKQCLMSFFVELLRESSEPK